MFFLGNFRFQQIQYVGFQMKYEFDKSSWGEKIAIKERGFSFRITYCHSNIERYYEVKLKRAFRYALPAEQHVSSRKARWGAEKVEKGERKMKGKKGGNKTRSGCPQTSQ